MSKDLSQAASQPSKKSASSPLTSLTNIRPLYFLPIDPLAEEVLIPGFRAAEKVDCMVGFFPIAGEPKDMVETVTAYNRWLQQTELPKLLFYATPGVLVTAPVVEWSKQNLKNLQTVDIGAGIHFLQDIGELKEYLLPYDSGLMKAYPLSPLVNSVKNQGPELIEEVAG